jgi:hypothetical protein
MTTPKDIVPRDKIEQRVLLIRGQKVMLDLDLAALYSVKTYRLNEQVKRNINRFPGDFMFQLTPQEFENLRSQIAISSGWGGRRHPPYAFTEQGVAMLSSVLNSPSANQVNIEIVRAFVRLRQILIGNRELARKLAQIEKKLSLHDEEIIEIFAVIKELMAPKMPPKKRQIGFKKEEE